MLRQELFHEVLKYWVGNVLFQVFIYLRTASPTGIYNDRDTYFQGARSRRDMEHTFTGFHKKERAMIKEIARQFVGDTLAKRFAYKHGRVYSTAVTRIKNALVMASNLVIAVYTKLAIIA